MALEHSLKSLKLKVWWQFTRPRTLVVTLMPILSVGVFVWRDPGSLNVGSGLIFLLAVLILQIACNFSNDYYDFLRGSDRDSDRLGPRRVLQSGELSVQTVRRAIFVLYAGAEICIIVLSLRMELAIFFLGQFSLLVTFAYTGGYYPLAYRGWGEVTAWFFFGPVIVCVGYMAFTGRDLVAFFSPEVGWAWPSSMWVLVLSLSYGSFAYSLISLNNLRDMEADKISGKRTLTVRWGRGFVYRSLILSEGIIILATLLLIWSEMSLFFILPAVVSSSVFFQLGRVSKHSASFFNVTLARTGLRIIGYTLFLIIAVLLSAL